MRREDSQLALGRDRGTRGLGLTLLPALLAGCTPLPPPPSAPAAEVRPRVLPASMAPYGRILGTIRSRATGQPVTSSTPLVVFVLAPCSSVPGTEETSIVSHGTGGLAPSFLVVPAGRRVNFANQDRIFHRFFSSSENQVFDTGLLAPGSATTVGLDRPGVINVYCCLHEGRQATIVVTPNSQHAIVGRRGEFVIEKVAPGPHLLEVWGEGLRPQRFEVDVPAHDAARLEIAIDDSRAKLP